MSRLRRRLYYRRSFLNRQHHHGLGAVLAEVELVRDPQHGLEVEAVLEISDCGRLISLDFGQWHFDTRSNAANALRKARLLQEVVAQFADALELAYAEQAADSPARRRR